MRSACSQCGKALGTSDLRIAHRYCSIRCAVAGRAARRKAREEKGRREGIRPRRVSKDALDDLARELCRRRGACEAPGEDGVRCKGSLQWAHIVGRGYHKVRWDADNCFLLCAAHHMFYTKRHVHWEAFLDRKIGREKYEELKRRALSPGKVDKEAARDRLAAELERGGEA